MHGWWCGYRGHGGGGVGLCKTFSLFALCEKDVEKDTNKENAKKFECFF